MWKGEAMTKKLVIFGTSAYSRIVYEYFTHDSDYEVSAFTVNEDYIEVEEFCGLPVVAFERVEGVYPPNEFDMHVAVVYGEINRLRARICEQASGKGYLLPSYVSSRCFTWHNTEIGENCFIFEDNTVQPFVKIGNNVILWSGNHIGHDTVIEDNVFITSHVVISGFCEVGRNTFIGVNTAVGNNLKIGKECWIGQGAVISKNIPDQSMVKGQLCEVSELNIDRLCKYLERESKKAKILVS
ncbi:MAG: sugar O-acyltransferase (sialic acid O-acetyltransferase NeuD family) [Chlamydiales bacterium]